MLTIEEIVCNKIQTRREKGLAKYGIDLAERSDLSSIDWLNHLQEELMDAALYIEKLLQQAGDSNG